MRSDAMRGRRPLLALVLLAIALTVGAAGAQTDSADLFRQSCFSCHTIGGGRLAGPDLKGVTQRRDRAWLERFIADPQAMIDGGDPAAAQLLQEARGVVMPSLALSGEQIQGLLDLIEAESQLEESTFQGIQVSDEPFTPEQVKQGHDLFTGRARLRNGGPSCLSCHAAPELGGLGGGRLGPDLTKVYERIPGRAALAAWLQAPATPTMQQVFAAQPLDSSEILPLVAWFEASAAQTPPDPGMPLQTLFLLGFAGMAAMLIGFDTVWGGRFRSVRRALVMRGER